MNGLASVCDRLDFLAEEWFRVFRVVEEDICEDAVFMVFRNRDLRLYVECLVLEALRERD